MHAVRYCANCGARVAPCQPPRPLVCASCGETCALEQRFAGPSLLTFTVLFAREKVLLLKRGHAPYLGKWAPPGGFVEAGESLEAAAIRETREEVGIELEEERLLPHAVMSQPFLNQVHVAFLACLDTVVAPRPAMPEALEARWFSQSEFPAADVWGPAMGLDIGGVYERLRSGAFHFYQRTDNSLRVIASDCTSTYLWRRAQKTANHA